MLLVMPLFLVAVPGAPSSVPAPIFLGVTLEFQC